MPAMIPAPNTNNCIKAEGFATRMMVAVRARILRVQSGVSVFAIDRTACNITAAASNFRTCDMVIKLVPSKVSMPYPAAIIISIDGIVKPSQAANAFEMPPHLRPIDIPT